MRRRIWFGGVRFEGQTVMRIIGLMRLPIWGGVGLVLMSLMRGVIFLVCVGGGTLLQIVLHRFFIAISWLSLMMAVLLVLLLTLLSGLPGVFPRYVGLCMLFELLHCSLGLHQFGFWIDRCSSYFRYC